VHTAQGAEAFARFYLEQVNKAWMAPDPEQIRPYALASCKTCANYVATSQWLLEHQMRYDSPPSSVGVSVVLPESTRSRALVELVNNQEQSNIVRVDGTRYRVVPHVFGGAQVEVDWADGAWRVRAVKATA
jgi:hypothetical protein